MTVTLESIRTLDQTRWPNPTKLTIGMPLAVPTSIQVTGNTGFFVIQWATVPGAEGYRIAVMSDTNLANPNIGMFIAYGQKTARYDYMVGNIVLTRNFAVQAFRLEEFSAFSSIASATSLLMTAAGSTEPTNPASSPGSGQPPGGGGTGGGGGEYGGGGRQYQL